MYYNRGCLQGAEVVLWLEEKLKDCVVAFFGVGTTVEEPGSSTEDHKENKDKAAVKTALALLSRKTSV